MKQIIIILLSTLVISCQNSNNNDKHVKILQQAIIRQFIRNIQLTEELKTIVATSANIKQDEKYLNDIKILVQKRTQCFNLGYDTIIVKSIDNLSNYQNYLLNIHPNFLFSTFNNEEDVWFQSLMIAEAEYKVLLEYASKICVRNISCQFEQHLPYYFFSSDSIKVNRTNYFIAKKVSNKFKDTNLYSLSNIMFFRDKKPIAMEYKIVKVDDVFILIFTPKSKGNFTIKAYQKFKEKLDEGINWDRNINFDFEVY